VADVGGEHGILQDVLSLHDLHSVGFAVRCEPDCVMPSKKEGQI
jgi:hypothetical protein